MITRIKNILLSPKSEWPVIAGESATIKSIYVPWVLVLVAIPAVFGFIKSSLIGYSALGVHVRAPIGSGIASMVLSYVLGLVMLFVVAWIINALAPTFQAEKNQVQALKTAAYAWTASWIAGFGAIIPWLGWLIAILGGVYSIYLLYLGLPHTMKCPQAKAGGYTAVSVIIAVVLSFFIGLIVTLVVGAGAVGSAMISGASTNTDSASVTVDEDSRLGALVALGKRMEAAGEKAEQADAANDPQAKTDAMAAMVAAMSGSDDGTPVEALTGDQLKAFLPPKLGDLERGNLSTNSQKMMGARSTHASATYTAADGQRSVQVELADVPVMGGMMALAGAFATESEQHTANGYEKTWVEGDTRFHEKWNKGRKHGEYGVMFGGRFQVTVKGDAQNMAQLKSLAEQLDLQGMRQAAGG